MREKRRGEKKGCRKSGRGAGYKNQGGSSIPVPGSITPEEGFYLTVLEEMERKLLKRAREVEGLDEEIALLRVKLASALAQEPRNTELLFKGLTVLIRAVATKARYSPKAEEEACNNIVSVIKELGSMLFNDKGRKKINQDSKIKIQKLKVKMRTSGGCE